MKPDLGIPGKRVLVTAGAGGIGRAIATTFADAGARVHVCDVDTAALASLAAERPDISASHTDVADIAQVERLFEDVRATLGGLHRGDVAPRPVVVVLRSAARLLGTEGDVHRREAGGALRGRLGD